MQAIEAMTGQLTRRRSARTRPGARCWRATRATTGASCTRCDDGDLLPAELPVAAAAPEARRVLRRAGAGARRRLPRVPSLRAGVRDRSRACDRPRPRAHRRPPRRAADARRALGRGRAQREPPAEGVQGRARPVAARLRAPAAGRALQVRGARGPHRHGRALRGRLRVGQPPLLRRERAPRDDAGRLQARRGGRDRPPLDGGVEARPPAGRLDRARPVRGPARRVRHGARGGAAQGLPARRARARRPRAEARAGRDPGPSRRSRPAPRPAGGRGGHRLPVARVAHAAADPVRRDPLLCRGRGGARSADGRRAVARACASNRVALVVPCHRVVRADGSLGGYRWGAQRKRLCSRKRKVEEHDRSSRVSFVDGGHDRPGAAPAGERDRRRPSSRAPGRARSSTRARRRPSHSSSSRVPTARSC